MLPTGVTLAVSVTATVVDATGGSATSGLDYTAFGSQVVTFAAGSANGALQPVTLGVLDDSILEGSETVNLTISAVGTGRGDRESGRGVGPARLAG